ncbi:hypothetical protein E3N88_10237 [Mikania micrantha]|uniref:Uncharacterized protein n=1 Tax=Mikania micrantha TaxID=192012 RepID=A0A5N6PCX1_9ASTR|nr:hypothetical protein E3N88_10237 [Mikania micrantha]
MVINRKIKGRPTMWGRGRRKWVFQLVNRFTGLEVPHETGVLQQNPVGAAVAGPDGSAKANVAGACSINKKHDVEIGRELPATISGGPSTNAVRFSSLSDKQKASILGYIKVTHAVPKMVANAWSLLEWDYFKDQCNRLDLDPEFLVVDDDSFMDDYLLEDNILDSMDQVVSASHSVPESKKKTILKALTSKAKAVKAKDMARWSVGEWIYFVEQTRILKIDMTYAIEDVEEEDNDLNSFVGLVDFGSCPWFTSAESLRLYCCSLLFRGWTHLSWKGRGYYCVEKLLMGYLWPDIGGTWGVPLLKTHRYQPMVWRNVPSLGLDMLLGIHGKFLGYQGRGLAVIFVVFQATWMWHRFCCYLAWSTLLRPGAGSLDVSDGAEVGCHGPLVAWWRGFLLGWVGGRGGIRQLGRGGIRLVLGCLYFPCSASLNLWKHGCKQVAWVGAASGQGLGWSLIGLGLFWAGVWLIRWKPAVAAQFWHVVLLPWLQDMWATPWDLVLVLSTAFSWAGVLHVRPKLRLSGLGGHAMACAAPDMLGEAPDELEAASVWPVAAPAWPVVAPIRPHGVPTTLACGVGIGPLLGFGPIA